MSAMEAGQLGQQLNHASQVAVPVAQVKRQPAADWSDWIFFAVGWICGVAWIAGVMRPLCRHPRFPAARNKAGWIANVIGTVALIGVIIAVAVLASRHVDGTNGVCCGSYYCYYC
ncbi:TPA: hypothetical protein ACH3X3_008155 [Trebouxia sp. C0006]